MESEMRVPVPSNTRNITVSGPRKAAITSETEPKQGQDTVSTEKTTMKKQEIILVAARMRRIQQIFRATVNSSNVFRKGTTTTIKLGQNTQTDNSKSQTVQSYLARLSRLLALQQQCKITPERHYTEVRSMIKNEGIKLHYIKTTLMIAFCHLTKTMGGRDLLWVMKSVMLR